MLRAEVPFLGVKYSPLEIPGCCVIAAPSEVTGNSSHPGAGIGKSRLGVRQQGRACRPGPGRGGIAGDRGLDQDGGGLPPFAGQLGWHLIRGDGLDQPVQRHQPVAGRGDQ